MCGSLKEMVSKEEGYVLYWSTQPTDVLSTQVYVVYVVSNYKFMTKTYMKTSKGLMGNDGNERSYG